MRARWIVTWVVAALVLLPVAFVAGIFVTHPRDEAQFIGELNNASFPQVWTSFVDSHDADFLIYEGDRACTWLSSQPYGLLRSAQKYQLTDVLDRYLAETKQDDEWTIGDNFAGRRVVATSAWNHLCAATRLVHQPYRPFGGDNG
jgi:hypothetical protein